MTLDRIGSILGLIVSSAGLIGMLITNGSGAIIIGKGLESVIIALFGLVLATRYSDRFHEDVRKGSYLGRGHSERFDVDYPPGSSKRLVYVSAIASAIIGAILVGAGYALGASMLVINAASGALFLLGTLLTARTPILKLVLINRTFSSVAFAFVPGIVLFLFFGPVGLAVSIIAVHILMSALMLHPALTSMAESARDA